MLLGTVIGNVWCTKKLQSLTGQAFLLVAPEGHQGPPLVCADQAGAGPGDQVLVMSNGGFGGIHGKLLAALEARG